MGRCVPCYHHRFHHRIFTLFIHDLIKTFRIFSRIIFGKSIQFRFYTSQIYIFIVFCLRIDHDRDRVIFPCFRTGDLIFCNGTAYGILQRMLARFRSAKSHPETRASNKWQFHALNVPDNALRQSPLNIQLYDWQRLHSTCLLHPVVRMVEITSTLLHISFSYYIRF